MKISIQALYDYKSSPTLFEASPIAISIQALYDYKSEVHAPTLTDNDDFNSSIVRL